LRRIKGRSGAFQPCFRVVDNCREEISTNPAYGTVAIEICSAVVAHCFRRSFFLREISGLRVLLVKLAGRGPAVEGAGRAGSPPRHDDGGILLDVRRSWSSPENSLVQTDRPTFYKIRQLSFCLKSTQPSNRKHVLSDRGDNTKAISKCSFFFQLHRTIFIPSVLASVPPFTFTRTGTTACPPRTGRPVPATCQTPWQSPCRTCPRPWRTLRPTS
jgi:hypothetical protein